MRIVRAIANPEKVKMACFDCESQDFKKCIMYLAYHFRKALNLITEKIEVALGFFFAELHALDRVSKQNLINVYGLAIQDMENVAKFIEEMDPSILSEKARAWIFQTTPKDYRLLNALTDERIGDDDVWEVNQYKNEIHSGHVGIIWMAGKEAGIYALVKTISEPKLLVDSPASTSHWVHEEDRSQIRLRVKIKYIARFTANNHVSKEQLETVSGLENLSILRPYRQQGTNFPVTKDEWLIISDLIREKLRI